LKDAPKRNPPGTLLSDWKCEFFDSKFCTKRGHRDACSADCWGNDKTKEEQGAALTTIKEEAIANLVDTNASEGKLLPMVNHYSSFFLHCTYISYFTITHFILYTNAYVMI